MSPISPDFVACSVPGLEVGMAKRLIEFVSIIPELSNISSAEETSTPVRKQSSVIKEGKKKGNLCA